MGNTGESDLLDIGRLDTEQVNPRGATLERLSVARAFDAFDAEDATIAAAVSACRDEVVAAIELVVDRLGNGGRLLYVGAGTSGRLGVLDAVECPPTFQSSPDLVQGRIAGGPDALVRSIEGAEDDREAGARAVDDVTAADVVFGIAASGRTPFVHGALDRASELGAATVFLACVSADVVSDDADVSIRIPTGAELLAGSTRLKAGTATKLVLNRVTTIAMARLGKVYRGRMVDVNTRANAKLTARGIGMLVDLTGVDRDEAARLLEAASGHVKLALVMQRYGCAADEASARLVRAGGFLHVALEEA